MSQKSKNDPTRPTDSVGGQLGVPKYRIVYDRLLRAIRRGGYPAGGKLPTETELMEEFQVSRITVVRALRDLQALGVVRRQRGSGTFVDAPRRSSLAGLGLIFPPLEAGSIFATVHQSLQREAQKRDWQIIFHEISGDTNTAQAHAMLEQLRRSAIRGLFYLPLPVSTQGAEINEAIAAECTAWNIPLVLLDRDLRKLHNRSPFDLIGSDNELGGFLAVQHLLKRGCRRIVFFTDAREHPTAEARLEGAANAVRLTPGAQLAVWAGDGDDREELSRMLTAHQPDGIACVNDMTAARVMRTLLRAGVKIPEQIKLTGFDDTSTAALLSVPLTTIRQSPDAMAIHAVMMMQQRLDRPGLPAATLSIACTLVDRSSTAQTP